MSKQVTAVFGPNGYLKGAFPGYRPRVGQIEMSLKVEDVATRGGRIVIEAPTGTGKSLSYLAALVPFAAKGEKVMITTATILLQQQLVEKDLPLLASILPERFTFAIAKGLSNYACRNEYEDWAGEMGMVGSRDPEVAEQWPIVRDWMDVTEFGDVSELPIELNSKVRLKMTTTSEDCLGRKCKFHDDCFAMQARKRARDADIVVANFSLFFVDLSIKVTDPDSGPLPPYRHVVFDEAHAAPDIARDFFGFRVSAGSVKRAVRFLAGNVRLEVPECGSAEFRARVHRESERFFDSVKRFGERRDYSGRIEQPGAFDPSGLIAALTEAHGCYAGAAALMLPAPAKQALANAMTRISAIREQLVLASENRDSDRFVYFIELQPIAVAMSPIHVGPILKQHLFDGPAKSIVMTSATLASGDEDKFGFFKEEIGCEGAAELQVDSPFDFSRVLLYLPRNIRDPNHVDYADDVADVAWDLAQAAGGRMLGLFTSFRILRHVRGVFERRRAPWRLLVHGDAPRAQLIEAFKKDETSVLLGCESFWTGVDVPGPALSAVLIDRLPFPHQNDPITGAIAAIDKRWFFNRSLPIASIAVRQGFGRLIRTSTDRGVVAIVDPRITGKGYGKKIERALPADLPRTRELADVKRFFTG